MKTLLVTGGAGFIGSNFIHYIMENNPGYYIVNLDKLTYAGNLENLVKYKGNPNYHFLNTDICDENQMLSIFSALKSPKDGRRIHIDIVVHFAAESHVDRSIHGAKDFILTNVMGTYNLLQAAYNAWSVEKEYQGKRFIHVSTDEVFGSLGPEGKFTEEMAYNPKNPYAASKAAADHLVRSYCNTYNFPAIISNCSNNFGPYQFPEKLIPLIVNNALNQKTLPIYGEGKNVRDWIYVEDHCRALELIIQRGVTGESYNIGGGNEKQNIEVVSTICEILDELVPSNNSYKNLIAFVKDRPGHDMRYAIDFSKIKNTLGWEPKFNFWESMKKTVKWYLDNPSWINNIIRKDYMSYYHKQYGHMAEFNKL